MTGLPIYIIKLLMQYGQEFDTNIRASLLNLSPYFLLYAPKILLFIFSFFTDRIVWNILKSRECRQAHNFENSTKSTLLSKSNFLFLIYSFFFTSLVFHTRTFSNTISSALLALLFMLEIKRRESGRNNYYLIIYGFIFTLGFFSNFIYAFYSVTVILMVITLPLFESPSFSSGLSQLFKNLLVFGFSTLFFFSLMIGLDTLFYSNVLSSNYQNSFRYIFYKLELIDDWNSKSLPSFFNFPIYITPINNIIYNSYVENLALHTLHFRGLHFFVNMPLLFGCTFFVIIFKMIMWIFKLITRNFGTNNWNSNAVPITQVPYIIWLSFFSWLAGIAILSIAPHQEPRFILPSYCPWIIMLGYDFETQSQGKKNDNASANHQNESKWKYQSKTFLSLCILHGILVSLFYLFVHQAGVVKSLISIPQLINKSQSSSSSNTRVIYHNTYSPPGYLLSYYHPNITVLGLEGIDNSTLFNEHLQRELENHDQVVLVGPTYFNEALLNKSSYPSIKLLSEYLHYSTETTRWSEISNHLSPNNRLKEFIDSDLTLQVLLLSKTKN
ncbi:predicted protein [Naegleria gruberi]|uniref:Mannosyltransferase n=1 Tax=Naegleria gruberi TaxID=5762 RepID=D2UX40_NAEGR|nr:uncharacterized protein NAEGRDRAFT_61626 [Naegleria gruberi]EFC50866.1 predicted protein [Naegleria gruberi]|eukprot:XP_002683610.1 predicted protein [Naegleria gruberi strain NEG-M]